MTLLNWNTAMETGIEEFDEHHKHLVHLLNLTNDSIKLGADPIEAEAVLSELIKYVDYHFAAEERWMEANSYPGIENHKAEHLELTEKVFALDRAFRGGQINISSQLLLLLMKWLTQHIIVGDAELGRFARQVQTF